MPFFSKIVKFLTRREETQKPRKAASDRTAIPIAPKVPAASNPPKNVAIENKAKKKSRRVRKKTRDENVIVAETKSKSADVKVAPKKAEPRLQPRRGDSVYPPSLRSAKKTRTKGATSINANSAESAPQKMKQKEAPASAKGAPSDLAEKTLLEEECGEVLTRDDVNQMIAHLSNEQKMSQKVEFDPWADLDVLKERSATIYAKKSARVNTAVAHSRLLDLEFESLREELATGDASIPHVSVSEAVFRRTYSVRDKKKMHDDTISLNDERAKEDK